MSDQEKPATQTVAAQGIEAKTTLGPAPGVDLGRLAKYPPFQAFIEELEPNVQGIPSDRFAFERGTAWLNASGEVWLDTYLRWWKDKGHWKGEDALNGAGPNA